MNDTLAPPPINFTREVMEIDHKRLEVTFDGKSLNIEDITASHNAYFRIDPPHFWFRRRDEKGGCLLGCFIILLAAFLFYGGLYYLIKTLININWGLLLGMTFIFDRVKNKEELDPVLVMTYNNNLEQGSCDPNPSGRMQHYPQLDGIAETVVISVFEGSRFVGSNSFTQDSPVGLSMEKDFKEEIEQLRKEGHKLACSWRLVTDKEYRGKNTLVLGLIKETFDIFEKSGCNLLLMTFHPDHAKIYEKILGATRIAERATTGGLSNAPAVLLGLDVTKRPKILKRMEERKKQ